MRYWEWVPRLFTFTADEDHTPCSFAGPWYQWLRNLALGAALAEATGRRPKRGFVIQLTLDEEIGGNGSVSLVRDRRFAGLPVLMFDATDGRPAGVLRGQASMSTRILSDRAILYFGCTDGTDGA